MKPFKSSDALKADAREQLLGKYKIVVLAYMIMQLFISGCLTLAESQINMQSPAGLFIYYAVYFIVVLLSAIFVAGQNYLYLNIARGRKYAVSDIWYAFKYCADRAIKVQLRIFLLAIPYAVPFLLCTAVMLYTKNYYFSIPVAIFFLLFLGGVLMLNLNYAQTLFLILDDPNESTAAIFARSRSLMLGHRWNYFYLLVSFIGVMSLSILTFGIATFWVYPYMTATKTNFYLALLDEEADGNQAFESLDAPSSI